MAVRSRAGRVSRLLGAAAFLLVALCSQAALAQTSRGRPSGTANLDAAIERYVDRQCAQDDWGTRRGDPPTDQSWSAHERGPMDLRNRSAPRASLFDAPILAGSFSSYELDDPVAWNTETTAGQAGTPSSQPTSAPAPPAEEDIWKRKKLTGDWYGARTELAKHGVTVDLRLTQFYQGVARGGNNTNFGYGGKVDLILDIDAHKMGLWEGLMINVHVEEQFGNGIIDDAGAMTLYNPQMYFPSPGYRDVAVTHVLVMQFLSKNFAFAAGKINVLDFLTMIYPERGAGVEGFANLNVLYPALPWFRWVNLSFLATGPVFLTDDEKIQGGLFALDLNNVTTTTGIPEVFDNGAGVLGFWRFFFDVRDKPGSLLFIAGGSTREYHSFESTDSGAGWENEGIIAELQKAASNKDDGVWSAAIAYDQVLWEEPANDKRNLRLFSAISVSDGDPSFSKVTGLASLEATGLLFDREKDRAGIGGFYTPLASDFKKSMMNVGVDLTDLWGIELYYNYEVTPWFHLTTDVQYVQNHNADDDPGLILGLRGVIDF